MSLRCAGVVERNEAEFADCRHEASEVVDRQAFCAAHALQARYDLLVSAMATVHEKVAAFASSEIRQIAVDVLRECGVLPFAQDPEVVMISPELDALLGGPGPTSDLIDPADELTKSTGDLIDQADELTKSSGGSPERPPLASIEAQSFQAAPAELPSPAMQAINAAVRMPGGLTIEEFDTCFVDSLSRMAADAEKPLPAQPEPEPVAEAPASPAAAAPDLEDDEFATTVVADAELEALRAMHEAAAAEAIDLASKDVVHVVHEGELFCAQPPVFSDLRINNEPVAAFAARPAPPVVKSAPAPPSVVTEPVVTVRFSPARKAIIRRDYPKGVPAEVIQEALHALPGPPVPLGRISIHAHKLGLKRPEWYRPGHMISTPSQAPLKPKQPGASSAPAAAPPQPAPIAAAPALRPPVAATPPYVPPAPAPRIDSSTDGCCWPLNDVKPYRFCGAPTRPRKSYCDKHSNAAKGSRLAEIRRAPAVVQPAATQPNGTTARGARRDLRPTGELSRFKGWPMPEQPSFEGAALSATNPAVIEGRTMFPSRVRAADSRDKVHLLVSGTSSPKTGGVVVKGPWRGMPIFTLTLEERATCPTSCREWRTCMGNGMPYPLRTSPGPALLPRLTEELRQLAASHRDGFLVRLHVLGDFFSLDYVQAWLGWLQRFKNLCVFGYTAHPRDSEIGAAIGAANQQFGGRWAVRFSAAANDAAEMGATTIWRRPEGHVVPEGIVCPAQTERTACCGTCGLCWSPAAASRRIVFVGHGRIGRPKLERMAA